MKKLLVLSFILLGVISNAQKISFDYDAAGNQTQRWWCTRCHDKSSGEMPKEIADLKDEDLRKFFPTDIISYYPNPVKEQLYLKWELINDNKVTSIQLYSLSGQLVKSISKLENTDNQIIVVQNYPEGIYNLILFYSNGDQKAIKIIKK